MKKFTVQLADVNGNVVEEKEIQVNENDILVMKFPEDWTQRRALHAYEGLLHHIEHGKPLIGLPDTISFEVIKIN